ncbi:hypothetical protein BJL90_17680 [Clostridium formicaceticum]|uniref:SAM-dependent methyltransferase n=1 Tax=Clostridium formicaceticum TaxID=1497 RepID=A0ABN4TB51_9CLOT|nr:hypothetical protein BJL90_17680 [Clostridium formicaceticum]
MKLTPRLKKIADLVPMNSSVADIGTDHGYLPIYLLQNGITSHVIASDVNRGPLETAEKNIQAHDYVDKIQMRLGSGLEVLKAGEVETVIIAGMGGILISELLDKVPTIIQSVHTFILQPMQAQADLRRYLVANNFRISKDLLVKEDHKIYEIIVVQQGTQIVEEDIYYETGFLLKSNPRDLAEEFIEGKIKTQKEIILQVQNQDSSAAMKKYKACKEKLIKLEEVLAWLKQ